MSMYLTYPSEPILKTSLISSSTPLGGGEDLRNRTCPEGFLRWPVVRNVELEGVPVNLGDCWVCGAAKSFLGVTPVGIG